MFGHSFWGAAYYGPSYWGPAGGGVTPPVVVDQGVARGGGRLYKRKKKKAAHLVTPSELLALQQGMAVPIVQPMGDLPMPQSIIEDDDEILLKALTVILH